MNFPHSVNGARATIQREIDTRGGGGYQLLGRYVRSKDGDMGIIVEYDPPSHAYGISNRQDFEVEFYVLESDPYWRLVDEHSGPYLYEHGRRPRPKNMMTLKSPLLQQGNEIHYREVNGLLYDLAGNLMDFRRNNSNELEDLSFVITQDLELKIGREHTVLSRGHTVIMAGSLTIDHGVVRYSGNQSGHYFPQGLEEVRGIKYLHRYFPWIKVPRTSVGRWLPEGLEVSEDSVRDHMVKILLEPTKERRRRLKQALREVWPSD